MRTRGNGIRLEPLQRSPAPDWNALASRILAILLTLKRQRRTALKEASRRGVSFEQLTAAAITGMVAEFAEVGEGRTVPPGA